MDFCCTRLFSIIIHHIMPCSEILCHTPWYVIISYHIVLYLTGLHHIALFYYNIICYYCSIHNTLQHVAFYYIILLYDMACSTRPYFARLHVLHYNYRKETVDGQTHIWWVATDVWQLQLHMSNPLTDWTSVHSHSKELATRLVDHWLIIVPTVNVDESYHQL